VADDRIRHIASADADDAMANLPIVRIGECDVLAPHTVVGLLVRPAGQDDRSGGSGDVPVVHGLPRRGLLIRRLASEPITESEVDAPQDEATHHRRAGGNRAVRTVLVGEVR
jgi:hypothetical protein